MIIHLLDFFGHGSKEVCLEKDICVFCGKNVNVIGFKSNLSIKEYENSGLCQSCQDRVFED